MIRVIVIDVSRLFSVYVYMLFCDRIVVKVLMVGLFVLI